MSINTFPSGIETLENTPRLREPNNVSPQVESELKNLSKAFLDEQNAALALLNSTRTQQGEATFRGPVVIAGATGSKGALAILADLFAAPARDNGRTV